MTLGGGRRHLRLVTDSDVPAAPVSETRRSHKRTRPKEPTADLYTKACDAVVGDCPKRCRYRLPTRRCVLQVASKGRHTSEVVALHMGFTRQAIDQIEKRAIRKLKALLRREPTSRWAQYLDHLIHLLAPEKGNARK